MLIIASAAMGGGVQQADPVAILLMMAFFIILIGGGIYLAMWRWRTSDQGVSAEPAAAAGFCRQCGYAMALEDKFCPDCGRLATKRVEPSP
jgi:hypothetical protein